MTNALPPGGVWPGFKLPAPGGLTAAAAACNAAAFGIPPLCLGKGVIDMLGCWVLDDFGPGA